MFSKTLVTFGAALALLVTASVAPAQMSSDHTMPAGDIVDVAATVVGMAGRELWRTVRSLPERGVAGGRTHDALIVAAAGRGRADRLLTFNVRDLEPLAEGLDVEIATPHGAPE